MENVAFVLKTLLKSTFDEQFTLKRMPGFVVSSVQNTNTLLNKELQKTIEIAPADPGMKATVMRGLSQLASSGLLSSGSAYSSQIQNTFTQIQTLFPDPAIGFLAYQKLSVFGDDFLSIPPTSPNRRIEKRNRDLQIALVKRQALIGMALTASQMSFASYEDAVAIRNRLAQKLDAELDRVGSTDEDATFCALSDLKAAMILDITERAANLARIKNIYPAEPMPALVMAYEIYGEIEQAEEIQIRNKVRNPNFMPAGKAVQVLIP